MMMKPKQEIVVRKASQLAVEERQVHSADCIMEDDGFERPEKETLIGSREV